MRACCGILRQRVRKGVASICAARFKTGDRHTVDEQMHDGRCVVAVGLQNNPKVIQQGAVDQQDIAGYQSGRRLRDDGLGGC